MSGQEQDQDRTEEATPFKLRKAREKGQVARGMDLGFVGSLLAFTAFVLFAGPDFVHRTAQIMRFSLSEGVETTSEPVQALDLLASTYWAALAPLLALGGMIALLLLALELIQLRGFIFTSAPLKPDFSRLNPMKGLKRLFSMRMLKEALKNLVKMAVYVGLAWLMITGAIEMFAGTMTDAGRVSTAMERGGKRLLAAFIAAAFTFMVIDQLIVRGEFRKQMRMSRSEVKREVKDREGEPRLKQKRKELHQQLRQQSEGLSRMEGSDVLITNPEHYAVALRYDPETMDAPAVRARGRNHFAQLLKRKARLLSIPAVADPPLARALFHDCRPDQPIGPQHFRGVAKHYAKLRRENSRQAQPEVEASHG